MSQKDYKESGNSQQEFAEEFTEQEFTEEEAKLAEKLAEEMRDVEIPKSLDPEQIEKLLLKKGKKKKSRVLKYVSIAASMVLVLGIAAYGAIHFGMGVGSKNEATDAAAADAGTESGSGSETEIPEEVKAEEGLQTAKSYSEIYDYVEAVWEEQNSGAKSAGTYVTEESQSDMAMSSESAADAGASAGNTSGSSAISSDSDYSETNTREAEVGEADIVKTDGSYIYVLNGSKIRIVDIRKDDMQEAGSVILDSGVQPCEMYVKDGKLIVFYSKTESVQTEDDDYGSGYQEYAVAETFDVSDPANPKSLGEISQSGSYDSVRIYDGYVYLFSNFQVPWETKERDKEAYIPLVQGELLKSDAVYMPQAAKGNQFLVITSFALDEPDQAVDSKAILSSGGECYVSTNHIYLYESLYDSKEDYNQTSIRKVEYHKGELKGIAQTKVWGHVKDSFCIDEYEGNLRLVTTVDPIVYYENDRIFLFGTDSTEETEASSNALYILNEELEVTGKIEKLAPDEDIYSARFMGDTGYFVTFEQVDPLFSVDLSDPDDPKVLGALKIPGFSDYLHPYGDGLLLGIGMDADMSGITNGVKLSMFDISDPTDVTEVQKEVLEEMYSTDVSYNYKLVMINADRNLIGFSAYGNQMHYYLYSYDSEKGFTCLLDKELSGYVYNLRGLYVGSTFYLVEGSAIESFSLDTFDKIDDIVL